MTQRGNDVSNICRFLPKLTVNGQFMRDFMAEESPCFALGLVEERKQLCGFLALRPAEVIPPEISGLGFNFGHALLGTTEFEVIQFVFSLLWLRDLQHTGQSCLIAAVCWLASLIESSANPRRRCRTGTPQHPRPRSGRHGEPSWFDFPARDFPKWVNGFAAR
jgi:hypothetical protein